MRDGANNCITICNMENIDPMGVHTGDSIVVAPSQTLTDKEYQMLRSASLNIIRALGIEGGCNVQFALEPNPIVAKRKSEESPYYVIEVNPRVSRSSALASKATGYPIARVAAKIAAGKRLDEIANKVTGKTTVAFEPALDYCVVKIPRWPFDKFAMGDRILGTQMKSTGETMAIERTFEAAFQKAIRSLEFGKRTLLWEDPRWKDDHYDFEPTDQRLWAILAALRRGMSIEDICYRTGGIDPWFLWKFRGLIDMEKRLLGESLTPELLREAKRKGFSDIVIGTMADKLPEQVRELRYGWGILPVYKMVDTCAAEFDAETPYFYSTYEQENEADPMEGEKAVVIGSGPIRIGQGIEFDYCSIHAAWALQEAEFKSIMVNSNPETVSTDFDTSDRLYFEPLDEESIRDILKNESGDSEASPPSIVQFGGQTAINLAEPLTRSAMPLLGSSSDAIDMAEDRGRFGDFLDRLGIPQPPGAAVHTIEDAITTAQEIGYPALVRPSYVLGGRGMEIVHNPVELVTYMQNATELDGERVILIDKYIEGKEVEVDAICDGDQVLIPGIMEHIERAGVHSGDSMAVYPALNLTYSGIETIVNFTTDIGLNLGVKGLMNIQYVVMPGDWLSNIFVIEVNPRASRTVPFLSKITGVPMIKVATNVMLGKTLAEQGYNGGLWETQPLVGIKAPVFSMAKLPGVDTYLGPEMKSTGEVMGIDRGFNGALVKALMASGTMLPAKGSILLSLADRDKPQALSMIKQLANMDYAIYATEGTASMIEALGIPVNMISKKISEGHPNVLNIIEDGIVNVVINSPTGGRTSLQDGFQIRRAATERRIPCFTSLDAVRVAVNLLSQQQHDFNIMPLWDYRRKDSNNR
ncbi:MAG: carbamoyl-phosphate synthase large subunit, partial [Chloroflexota bacterium]|nr:carbamoyl-phosphate synthase large subunit [Chloroflexota bacterium]